MSRPSAYPWAYMKQYPPSRDLEAIYKCGSLSFPDLLYPAPFIALIITITGINVNKPASNTYRKKCRWKTYTVYYEIPVLLAFAYIIVIHFLSIYITPIFAKMHIYIWLKASMILRLYLSTSLCIAECMLPFFLSFPFSHNTCSHSFIIIIDIHR